MPRLPKAAKTTLIRVQTAFRDKRKRDMMLARFNEANPLLLRYCSECCMHVAWRFGDNYAEKFINGAIATHEVYVREYRMREKPLPFVQKKTIDSLLYSDPDHTSPPKIEARKAVNVLEMRELGVLTSLDDFLCAGMDLVKYALRDGVAYRNETPLKLHDTQYL